MKRSMRIVSLIIFWTLSFNMFLFSFSVSADHDETFEKEITVLNKLGIFDNPYSLLYSEEAITREEFVVCAMKMLKAATAVSDSESIFFDVETESPSYAYIKAAYDYGVISGIGAGLFGAKSEITAYEAISILLKCIKYDVVAESAGGYPSGYGIVAKQLEITEGVNTTGYINKGQAARLIFNTMEAPFLDKQGINYTIDFSKTTENTLFKMMYDVHKERGIITENRYVAIPAGDGLLVDAIKVNDIIIEEGTTLAGDFLGYQCDIYYQDSNDGIKTALYVEGKGNNCINKNSLYVKEFDSSGLTYYTDDNEKEVKISPYAVTIWNNAIYKVTDRVTLPVTGEFELIDNNEDNIYDIIKIKSYETFVVSSINYETNIIYNFKDATENIRFSDYDDVEICDINNNALNIKDIQPDSVLCIEKNKEKTYIKIVVCKKTDKFVVKKIQENSYGELIVSDNDNNSYTVSLALSNKGKIELGKSYSFGLNLYGKIAYIFSDENEYLKYGYLMKWITNKKGVDEKAIFKILTAENEIKSFTAREKIRTNSGNDSAINIVEKQNSPTVINYSIDDTGLLSSIYFPSTDENSLHVCGIAAAIDDSRYSTQTKTIGGQILVDTNTIIFAVGDDTNEESDFEVYPISTLKNDSYYINSTGYSIGNDNAAAEAVVINSSNTSVLDYNSPLMIFDHCGSIYDQETQEVFDVVCGYIADEYVEIKLSSDVKLTYTEDDQTFSVSQGDVLQVLQNTNGELIKFNVVYSNLLGKIRSSNTASNTGFAANERYDIGIPCYKKSDTFRMILKGETEVSTDIYVPLATRTTIYEYDSSLPEDRRIQVISFEEMEAYNGHNDFDGMAFVSIYKTIPKIIVIYK